MQHGDLFRSTLERRVDDVTVMAVVGNDECFHRHDRVPEIASVHTNALGSVG